MGAWNGKWELNIATTDYKALKVGRFTLKKVPGHPGEFKVETTSGSKPAKWLNVIFKLQAGLKGPKLPYPLPKSPKPAHLAGAGSVVRWLVKKGISSQTGQPIPGSSHEFLAGDVPLGSALDTVWLFKIDKALLSGKDLLVAFRKVDLTGGIGADGSVSGVRR